MKKLLKGLAMTSILSAFALGLTANVHAGAYNYSGQFETGVWLGGSSPIDFYLTGTQYFIASQSPKYPGNPCGVSYQIRDDVLGNDPIYKRSDQYGTFSGKRVDVSGPTGYHNAFLQNLYSSSYTQVVYGTFYY